MLSVTTPVQIFAELSAKVALFAPPIVPKSIVAPDVTVSAPALWLKVFRLSVELLEIEIAELPAMRFDAPRMSEPPVIAVVQP